MLLHWPYDASQSTSAIIACVETVCVGILLYFQHLYDLKPPAGMSIYLTFGILVELTVAWSRFHASTFSTSAAFSFIGHSMPLALLIKTCLLGLHEKTKWSHLKEEVRVELTPKSTRGFWVQSLIGLCDAILLLRYTAADLDINAIGNFNPNLKTQTLVDMFEPVWENCIVGSYFYRILLLTNNFRSTFTTSSTQNNHGRSLGAALQNRCNTAPHYRPQRRVYNVNPKDCQPFRRARSHDNSPIQWPDVDICNCLTLFVSLSKFFFFQSVEYCFNRHIDSEGCILQTQLSHQNFRQGTAHSSYFQQSHDTSRL